MSKKGSNSMPSAGLTETSSKLVAGEFKDSIPNLEDEKLEEIKVLIEMELMERDRYREIKPEQFPNQ